MNNIRERNQLYMVSFFIDGMCMQVEDDCRLNSGEEIATAVNQILAKIQMEGGCFFT